MKAAVRLLPKGPAQPKCPNWPDYPGLDKTPWWLPRALRGEEIEVPDDMPIGTPFSVAYDPEFGYDVCIDEHYAHALNLEDALRTAWVALSQRPIVWERDDV